MNENDEDGIIRVTGGAVVPKMRGFRRTFMDGASIPSLRPLTNTSQATSAPPISQNQASQSLTQKDTGAGETKGRRK